MKQIVFLTTPVIWKGKPFKGEKMDKTFRLFAELGKKNGIQVCFSSPYKVQNGKFVKHWVYNGKWVLKRETLSVKTVYVFLAYQEKIRKVLKELSKNTKIRLINDYAFIDLCFDKKSLAKFIPKELHPQTFLVNTRKELVTAVKKIDSSKVVLKPRYGIRGFGVGAYRKNRLPKEVLKNTIVQSFIEMDKINGRVYDLRLMMINNRLDHAYYRIAQTGSFKTNCSLGATKKIVNLEKIPGEAWEIAAQIDNKVAKYGTRIYSIDLIRDKLGKYYVLELESMPGYYHYSGAQSKFRKKYLNNIFKSLDI